MSITKETWKIVICISDKGEFMTKDELIDAWGKPVRLLCPGRRDPAGFELSSDGPDGLPGGLDRVQ